MLSALILHPQACNAAFKRNISGFDTRVGHEESRKCEGIRGFSRWIRHSIARKIRRVFIVAFICACARPLFEITPLASPVRGIGKITRTGRVGGGGGRSGVARRARLHGRGEDVKEARPT